MLSFKLTLNFTSCSGLNICFYWSNVAPSEANTFLTNEQSPRDTAAVRSQEEQGLPLTLASSEQVVVFW